MARVCLLLALIALSLGMIIVSARSIRYRVSGKPTTELAVTELSLTHDVTRGANGALVTSAEPPGSGGSASGKGNPPRKPKACPT